MTAAGAPRIRWPLIVRWLLTVFLLAGLVWWLDTDRLVAELARFSIAAVWLGLLVSVGQVVLSAWRWRFTAQRLGLVLPMTAAIREYYLAMFLNQCLPGGVVGDVNRALRHGSGTGARQASIHAVMIERLSGQLVMFTVAVASGFWMASEYPDIRSLFSVSGHGSTGRVLVWSLGICVGLVLGVVLWRKFRHYLSILGNDIYRGLLSPRTLPAQLGSSLLVVASYLGVFLLLAADVAGNFLTLVALCSLLLLAMVIPVTVAGWGVREGAAALLWPLAGLPAEQGVALSVGYGLVVLLSSLPGSLFVFTRPSSGG